MRFCAAPTEKIDAAQRVLPERQWKAARIGSTRAALEKGKGLVPAIKGLGHLEAELVALVAEVFRFAVHVVAVRAVELILIVRGDVRIRRLDVLCLFNEILGVVALRAGLDVGRGRIGLVVFHKFIGLISGA